MVSKDVLNELFLERTRQDRRWGQQEWPSVMDLPAQEDPCRAYGIPTESVAKASCDAEMRDGTCTWAGIALEEFCEVVSAGDDQSRRVELVQLAAVILAWIECIDRRAGK